jgi:hypothetical protein
MGNDVPNFNLNTSTAPPYNNSVFLTSYYSGNQINNEMGRACSIYVGEDRCIQHLGEET